MELNEESVEEFRKELRDFSKLDDEISKLKKSIKPIQDKIKELNKRKKELEKCICETMDTNNLDEANVEGVGNIEYKTTKAVVPVTQKTIKEKFILFFESGPASRLDFNSKGHIEKGELLFTYIYAKENRDTITKEKLVKKKE